MIFPPIELPQYIVVPPTDCEMTEIIGYHNKSLTIKFPSQAAFLEKCACLLSAMYLKLKQYFKRKDTQKLSLTAVREKLPFSD